MSEGSTGPARIEIDSADDSVMIKQLVVSDAQAYFDLIEFDRAHLSQSHHGEEPDGTAQKYQTVNDVIDSIAHPKENKYRFGIWDGDSMVGSNNLTLLSDRIAETGSWVGAQHTGSNYASRGRKLLLEFAFDTLGLEKVLSYVEVGNDASRKSVEASGYELVGEENGRWVFSYEKSKWSADRTSREEINGG